MLTDMVSMLTDMVSMLTDSKRPMKCTFPGPR